ncbi:uncharacterized protein N7459_009233 [Penicillium hispanicum]|uniref:uncharacterized protein n=1 Tax=Penicillium hispanicum TaxID=1080232 RepID=UPI00253FE146|nr:uncharacterized protein N7459_009233 [Penicillium hispanicum]KAJ5569803.1 hypothetical protein N7459_009233 [Penicillium hispanicum]
MNKDRLETSPSAGYRRPQSFSLSLAFRSSRKRNSVLEPPDILPTCQERIHYPIYNPRDPRHNPALADNPWRRRDSQTSSSDSQKPSSWVQDLPRRSLRKARSGLLALRAGLLRRSSRQTNELSDGEPRLRIGWGRGHKLISGLSSASTQEDLNFGVDLYRTSAPWPTVSGETHFEPPMRVASFRTPGNVVTAPTPLASSPCLVHEPASAHVHHVSVSTTKAPSYDSIHGNALDSRRSKELEMSVDFEHPIDGEIQNNITDDLTRYASSADWETLESSGDGDLANSGGTHEAIVEQTGSAPSILEVGSIENGGSRYPKPGLVQPGSEMSDDQSSGYELRMTAYSRGSYTLPDQDFFSVLSSNASERRHSSLAASEAFATQERLCLEHGPPSFKGDASPVSGSRNCSAAEVTFAFPGIYHALLEQWMRERSNEPVGNVENLCNISTPQITITSDPSHKAPETQGSFPGTSNGEGGVPVGTDCIASSQQIEMRSTAPIVTLGRRSLEYHHEMALQNTGTSSSTIADTVSTGYGGSITAPPAEERPSESIHAFGLHISPRNEVSGIIRSSYQAPLSSSFNEESPTDNRSSIHSVGACDTIGSICDVSEHSTNYTRGSTTSAEVTSATSMSPLDSPIDEEVMFSSFWRDEYYMADGKTSSYNPDQGDQPVKIVRHAIGDGSIHSGPGLDRAPFCRIQELPEAPRTIRGSSPAAVRAVIYRDGSDSTDSHSGYGRTGNFS